MAFLFFLFSIRWRWFKGKKNIVSKKEILIDPESPVMSRCHEFPGLECPDSFTQVYRFHYEPISVPKKKDIDSRFYNIIREIKVR